MRKLLTRVFGDPSARTVKKLEARVAEINALEPALKKKSDSALKAQTKKFKAELSKGKKLDDLLPEAFATVREAARRSLGQRHFDVQLMGGMALHQGSIAEMKTGEGKTLVATLAVYLNALEGKGVHVVTVNDYLAQRDGGWMGQVYHALGLSTGVVASGNQALLYDHDYINQEHDDERLQKLKPATKQEAYAADITYGTNNEFGFDYLRDNMVSSLAEMVQRPLNYAIVDEVDSILIDEARTPLIISAPASENATNYQQFSSIARQLKAEDDYALDEKANAVTLTDDGIGKVEKLLGIANLYDPSQVQNIYHTEQALRAETLFKKDKDYVVRDGEVVIVDEFTGRLLPGRRYSEGLHQAIEAKEGVNVLQESMTLATISFQNYFRLYNKLAGMTGTAKTEEEEFHTVYGLEVLVIPPNMPSQRHDQADRIYKTEAAKYRAIVEDVAERYNRGQPVLIGTVSIEKNELLSQLLKQAKIPHQVLNAKNNEGEAAIVAGAGQQGAVTLATNIAGRGTDIVLGDGVVKLGGLHVLGSERHEARRIDNQLRGRSGRQGDPGSTQFYVSVEDDLMRVFGGERIASLMNTLRVDEDIPIENKLVSRALESAQKRVESHNYDIRKQVLQYDDVMNRHREAIYKQRRQLLESQDLSNTILDSLNAEVEELVRTHVNTKTEELDSQKAAELLASFLPLTNAERNKLAKQPEKAFAKEATALITKLYKARQKEFGTSTMRTLERLLYLQVLDRYWMQHLETMQHLREGIHLRSIGQRDPLVEYKKEAFTLFNTLNQNINREVATTIFRLAPVRQPEPVATELTEAAGGAQLQAPNEGGVATKQTATKVQRARPAKKKAKVGRNDPCPCGSGLKYKKCGLIGAPEHRG